PATEYVADFVAHMNPLNVLRACDIMAPLEGTPDPDLPAVPGEKTVREVMDIRLSTGKTVLVEENGSPTGQIGDEEIYRSLLKKQTNGATT
ncbi:MAG: choline ABC transporter ATP-binding protein, partial [Stappiaceae bacterium]